MSVSFTLPVLCIINEAVFAYIKQHMLNFRITFDRIDFYIKLHVGKPCFVLKYN
jgi:hypothetical protein